MKKLFAFTALLALVAFNANAQIDVAGTINNAASKVDAAAASVATTKSDAAAKVDEVKANVAAQKTEADNAIAAKKQEDKQAVDNMKKSLNNLQNAF